MAMDRVTNSMHPPPPQERLYSLDQFHPSPLLNLHHDANLAVHAAQAHAAQLRALHSAVISGSFVGGGDMICGANPPPSPAIPRINASILDGTSAIPLHLAHHHPFHLHDGLNPHTAINHHLNDGVPLVMNSDHQPSSTAAPNLPVINTGDTLCTSALLRSTHDYPVFTPAQLQLQQVQRQLRQLEAERRIAEYYSSEALRAERINYILDNDNKSTFPGLVSPSPTARLPSPIPALPTPPPPASACSSVVNPNNIHPYQLHPAPSNDPRPPSSFHFSAAASSLAVADSSSGDGITVQNPLADQVVDDKVHLFSGAFARQTAEFGRIMPGGDDDSGVFQRMSALSELLSSDDDNDEEAGAAGSKDDGAGGGETCKGGSNRNVSNVHRICRPPTSTTQDAARAIMRFPFLAQGAIAACGRCDAPPAAETASPPSPNQYCRSSNSQPSGHHRRNYSCMSSPLLVPLIDNDRSSTASEQTIGGIGNHDTSSCQNLTGGGHGENVHKEQEHNCMKPPRKLKKWFSGVGRSSKKSTLLHSSSADRRPQRRGYSTLISNSEAEYSAADVSANMAMELMELRLVEANSRRDEAIAEVSKMRVVMAEMVKKLQEVEKDCRELRTFVMVPAAAANNDQQQQHEEIDVGTIAGNGVSDLRPPNIIEPPPPPPLQAQQIYRSTAAEDWTAAGEGDHHHHHQQVLSRSSAAANNHEFIVDGTSGNAAYVAKLNRMVQLPGNVDEEQAQRPENRNSASLAAGFTATAAAATKREAEAGSGFGTAEATGSTKDLGLGFASTAADGSGFAMAAGRDERNHVEDSAKEVQMSFSGVDQECGGGGGAAAAWSGVGSERLLVVVQPSKEEFAAAVAEARVAVKQLSRAVIVSLRQKENSNAAAAAGSTTTTTSSQYYYYDGADDMLWMMEEELEAALNRAMYDNFESAGYDRNAAAAQHCFHPAERAAFCYRAARSAASFSPAELLRPTSAAYDPAFDAFCARKMRAARRVTAELSRAAAAPLLEAAERLGGEFARRFAAAARALWVLHLLAMSFPTPASLLRVPPLSPFDPRFMEPLPQFSASGTMSSPGRRYDAVVASMLMPGFFLPPDALIKSKVLLFPPPPPPPLPRGGP